MKRIEIHKLLNDEAYVGFIDFDDTVGLFVGMVMCDASMIAVAYQPSMSKAGEFCNDQAAMHQRAREWLGIR